MLFAIDLEGRRGPEICALLGGRFELPELALTTRDLADFSELMHLRIAAVSKRGLTLKELQTIAHAVEPYLGANGLIGRLRAMGNVVIISDTFHEFSDPLAMQLGGGNLFAHLVQLDPQGRTKGL